MTEYREETYGEYIADLYDTWYPADAAAIDMLAELAEGGPALELGIGTGRIALPLQARGIEVYGIDASPAMIAKLRAKPGGEHISVVLGSFADFDLPQRFNLIYVVFNTFFSLLTQEEQMQCFASVAHHLRPDGVFVIEAFVPDLCRFSRGQNVSSVDLRLDAVKLDVSKLDKATQQVMAQHVLLSEKGIRLFPVKLRFAWPSELDLMARLAGMKREHRWSNWQGHPFGSDSGKHISVYGLDS